MSELLNIAEQDPEEYKGKSIYILDREYIVGELIGEGGYNIVYQLINKASGICNYVIRIPIDQQLAAGSVDVEESIKLESNNLEEYQRDPSDNTLESSAYQTKSAKTSIDGFYVLDLDKIYDMTTVNSPEDLKHPWQNKNYGKYLRDLAKRTYNYGGYQEKKLPIFCNIVDIEEFYDLNNRYNGIFAVVEFFNGPGDEETGGIYNHDYPFSASLLLFKINLRKNSIEVDDLKEVVEYCDEYLTKYNKDDDNVMDIYICASIHLSRHDEVIDEDKVQYYIKRMLEIEPLLRSHIKIAMIYYYQKGMAQEIIDLFESFCNYIYEPYSDANGFVKFFV